MNIAAHNPKFLNGLSITRLLSRIAILTSQLDGAKKQITTMTSQIMDLTNRCNSADKKNMDLTSQNTAYLQRINELERSATLDSNNSCKPPSSDGLRKPNGKKDKDKKDKDKKKRTNSLREKSGRKSGGQPGHEGNTLKQVADPDEIIDILPEQCPNCQTEFSLENSTGCVHRQVFDLPPPPPPLVVEYRRHTCKCTGCGDEFKGQFPADVTAPVQYGKRVASYVTYYQTSQVVPGNRLVEILRDMHGMKASEATVMKMIGDSAQRLKPVYDLLQKKIAGDPNITTHLDETGFRTEEKLHWVHTTSSKTMSHFRVGNSRGDILLDLAGNVIHDCYAPYWKILGVKHGTCNFHITRELKALFEIDNEPWAGEMRIILFNALKLTDNAREQGKDAVDPKDISAIEERFYACLKKAIAYHESLDPLVSPTDKKKRGRKKRRIGHNLAIRLLKFDESVLLFLHDLNVPFSNNEAERDLRMIKVRQKVSGCFRTKQGLENFCILRSIVETARKQGWDILETLQKPPDELIRMIEAA